MSLLTSIFGSKETSGSSKKGPTEEGETSAPLFDQHVEVPEPKALPPSRTKKRDSVNNKENARKKQKVHHEEDSEEKNERSIFVGNLPVSTTRKDLTKLFSKIGKVESARLRSAATTGVKVAPDHAGDQNLVRKVCFNTKRIDTTVKNSIQGYVVFQSKESAKKAIDTYNSSEIEVNGEKRRIRVDSATPTMMEPARTVFVGNLPYATDEMTLQDHFATVCQFSIEDIEGVRIVRDKETFQCKGFAYVLLKDKSMVAKALRMANETEYLKQKLRVQVCSSKSFRSGDPKKQKEVVPERKKNKQRASGEKQATPRGQDKEDDRRPTPYGALRRLLAKEAESLESDKKRRARGEKKKSATGKSKRKMSETKTEQRVKKLEKRVKNGMGKARKK